jgi:hypothetical protein
MQPVHAAGVLGSAQFGVPPELEPELDPDPELDPEPEPDEDPDDEPEPPPELPPLPLEEVLPLEEPLVPPPSAEPESFFLLLPSVEASFVPSKMSVAPLQCAESAARATSPGGPTQFHRARMVRPSVGAQGALSRGVCRHGGGRFPEGRNARAAA